MSCILAVIKLHNFLDQLWLGDKSCLLHLAFDGSEELLVVAFLHFDVGEEIVKQ